MFRIKCVIFKSVLGKTFLIKTFLGGNMKRFLHCIVLYCIVLTAFSSCKNRDFKDYIEQGFSKPIVEDVSFSKSNIGDGNKLYVPSEEDIDVQFTIRNRYAKELTGSLQFDEAKKALFSKEPFIKDLTPTKMIVAFNFKEDAEPKAVNSFLGELVEVTASIFEKKTGRYLSSQKVKLGCNTPPLPIKDSDIQYDEINDKFIVTLPQEIRKHKDLKEVRFTLSDSLGNVAREAKIVSIALASEQGQAHTLEIKGSENWQLDPPVGQRRLKAIVYDKAGLKSGEKEGKPTRLFNAITLDPPNQSVLCSELKTGVPVPKIVELEDFANGDGWKNDSTYKVTYSGPGFTYYENESGGKKTGYLKNENATEDASYTVTVKLEQGGILVNTRSTTYTISVIGDDTTELDKSAITVEDITKTYNNVAAQRLTFRPNSISFTTSSDNTEEGRLEIPYTGSETKLKVYIKAISKKCKGEDDDGTKWSSQHEKTYEITIPEASSSVAQHIRFKITAPSTQTPPISKNYDIEFTRGGSVKVTLEFKNEPTLTGNKEIATGKVLWEVYNKKAEIGYKPDGASTNNKREITVRKGADVKFTISLIEGVKVKECTSNIGHNTSSAIPNGCEGLVLNASEDFTLTVLLRPEASVKWENHQTSNFGYRNGKISYTSPGGTNSNVNLNGPDLLGRAVENETSATFELVGFNAETHFVERWIVKHGDVTDDVTSNVAGKYELGENNSTLKIAKVEGEYEVEVVVKKFCKVVVEIGKYDSSNFGTFTGHKYQITATNTETSSALNPKETLSDHTYTFLKIKPNTTIKFVALAGTDSVYEFVKWEYKKASSGVYDDLIGKTPLQIIDEDMNVRLILKKIEYKLTVNFKEVKMGYPHLYTLTATDITDSSTPLNPEPGATSDTYTYKVTKGHRIELTIINGTKISYAIKKWQSGTTDLPTTSPNHQAEITMTEDKNINIQLIPQYTFKITHEGEADSGLMDITTGNSGNVAVETVMKWTSSEVTKAIEGKVWVNVSGLDPKDMVACYKKDTNEFSELFDGTSGLWKKGLLEVNNLGPGETLEVTIARFHRINISLRDYTNNKLYTGNEYALKVSKMAGVGRLLPKFENDPDGTVTITRNRIDGTSECCTVYVSKGVTLQFDMKDLNEQKEIGEWKGTLINPSNKATFNKEPDKPDLTLGETSNIQYKLPSAYQNTAYTLNACIRGKTKLLSFSIEDYKNKGKIMDAKIKLHVNYSGSDGNAEIFTISGSEDIPKNCRIEETKTIKLEIEEETTHEYYFAEWEGDSSENRFNKIKTVSLGSEVSTIRALCTKNVIVMVHPPMPSDKGNSNFPGEYFPNPDNERHGFGVVRIGKKNEIESSSSANEIDCKEVGIQYTNVLISQFNTANGGELAVKFVKDTLVYNGANVFWRYSFGGDGKNPQYDSYDNNPFGHEGIKFSATPGKILEFKNPPKCAFVHIWLRKVQVYSGP